MPYIDAIYLHRIGHWLYRHHVPIIPGLIQLVIFLIFNSYIPRQLVVGDGVRLGHRGIGVVINKDATIGNNVLIRAHVTIGKRAPDERAPIIGSGVEIGDGAKIIGDVTVGESAVIGANAVVVSDIPAGAVAVGVPAKPIRQS